jgi:hypothetical protein
MRANEAALAAELQSRHGVTTAKRLAALGITRRAIETLVRTHRLVRVGNGVLACSTWPDTLEHRMAAACAMTGGVVVFPTAGLVWRLRKSPQVPEIHVCISNNRRIVEPPGVRVHRTRNLPDSHIVRRADGIAVTSPPRTAVDAAAVLDREDLESLIENGIDRGYFTLATVQHVAAAASGRGRSGRARLTTVLAERQPSQRPVRSDYELRLERAMRGRGFPPLVREHRLVLTSGEVIHPDLGIPDDGFFVEVDHSTWHGRRRRSSYDQGRDLRVRADGFAVERVSDVAIDEGLIGTVENLWRVWQSHRRRMAAGR